MKCVFLIKNLFDFNEGSNEKFMTVVLLKIYN